VAKKLAQQTIGIVAFVYLPRHSNLTKTQLHHESSFSRQCKKKLTPATSNHTNRGGRASTNTSASRLNKPLSPSLYLTKHYEQPTPILNHLQDPDLRSISKIFGPHKPISSPLRDPIRNPTCNRSSDAFHEDLCQRSTAVVGTDHREGSLCLLFDEHLLNVFDIVGGKGVD